jgi:hypothetical protein
MNFRSLISSSSSPYYAIEQQKYILYIGFSIGFSCQADNYKIPAQQQAVNVAMPSQML